MIKNIKIVSIFSLILFAQTNTIFSSEKEESSKKEKTEQLKKEIWFWRLAYPITIIVGLFTIFKLNSKIKTTNHSSSQNQPREEWLDFDDWREKNWLTGKR